ncbi:hypothetical protein LTR37_012236 [Vermiconidia calcicola]|uniref:Uncharacterized protein n=1 Tax=Vermiconidia calcicola TaxID=1690605 RepID=A0ACC3N110_9PEZI|nr:hypothetical protein LTR37_012236 [Vermiconidia calcicola]
MALDDSVGAPTTLAPLSDIPSLQRGLIAVSFFGFLSFATSVVLFFRLAWRLLTWGRKSGSSRVNQFVILLFNLIFADIQQSIAFLLNARWLSTNSITVGTSICWAQGWFVSTGDLASGLFTLAIAVHAFMDIVYDFRLGPRSFGAAIAGLWAFNFACAVIGVAMHPRDLYTRAGAWCWMDLKYENERLWLHYFWVILAEFGTVAIYALIWIILQRRVKAAFYTNSETALRARSAAKLIIAYPIVYVVCTLPLVKARLSSMNDKPVSFVELCVAGSMITSNGWLDVLLYTVTRADLFNSAQPADEQAGVLETFRHRPDQAFGTTTTIEANHHKHKKSLSRSGMRPSRSGFHTRSGSTEELFVPAIGNVKAETTVVVRTDNMEMDRIRQTGSEAHENENELSKDTLSLDSQSQTSRK